MAVRVSAAALIVVTLTGCGGGHALSRPQYAARANALCRAFHARVAALGAIQPDPATRQGRVYLKKVNDMAGQLVAKLRALRAPKSLAATRERWFSAVDTIQKETARLTHGRADVALTRAQERKFQAYYRRADAAARALGATACASGAK